MRVPPDSTEDTITEKGPSPGLEASYKPAHRCCRSRRWGVHTGTNSAGQQRRRSSQKPSVGESRSTCHELDNGHGKTDARETPGGARLIPAKPRRKVRGDGHISLSCRGTGDTGGMLVSVHNLSALQRPLRYTGIVLSRADSGRKGRLGSTPTWPLCTEFTH